MRRYDRKRGFEILAAPENRKGQPAFDGTKKDRGLGDPDSLALNARQSYDFAGGIVKTHAVARCPTHGINHGVSEQTVAASGLFPGRFVRRASASKVRPSPEMSANGTGLRGRAAVSRTRAGACPLKQQSRMSSTTRAFVDLKASASRDMERVVPERSVESVSKKASLPSGVPWPAKLIRTISSSPAAERVSSIATMAVPCVARVRPREGAQTEHRVAEKSPEVGRVPPCSDQFRERRVEMFVDANEDCLECHPYPRRGKRPDQQLASSYPLAGLSLAQLCLQRSVEFTKRRPFGDGSGRSALRVLLQDARALGDSGISVYVLQALQIRPLVQEFRYSGRRVDERRQRSLLFRRYPDFPRNPLGFASLRKKSPPATACISPSRRECSRPNPVRSCRVCCR
ncbi:hypothetical protein ACVWZV_000242 [Bradyrhizobium sp. GM5.1]